jgi:glycosyltransferase involved in cell wall biosynthesis
VKSKPDIELDVLARNRGEGNAAGGADGAIDVKVPAPPADQPTPAAQSQAGEAEQPAVLAGRTLAVVMRAFEGGGAQRDMVLLCNALAATGVDIAVLTLRSEGPLRTLLDPAIPVVDIPGQRIRYAVPGLRRAMLDLAPGLVVSSESNLNLFSLMAVRSLPPPARPKLVLREVGSPSLARRHDPYLQNRIAYRFLRLYRHADRVITLTEGARQDLARHFAVPADKISVMRSNAVVPPDAARRIANWDAESGRERDLIVSVGRLSREKNHDLLLRALALLPPTRPWRLALVGDGPQRSKLEALARRKGLAERITFAGYSDDPFAWMMRARLAVCSSVYEGLGNAVIEALACGTPVVSTDCPYGPREILQHGRYGTLVPVGDATSLAAAIATALDRPVERNRLTRRGFDYTAKKAAASFLELIADL